MKKILDLSSRSVAIGSMLIMAFAVVGCDDDDSWSPSARPNDEPGMESSSSVEFGSSSSEMVKPQSSSSEKFGKSSSSVIESSSSSVKLRSSSSVGTPESSSSEISSSSAGKIESSSSSVALATPCKTETEDNCEYGELTDDRNGQTYKAVKIGAQWWMAENLNYKTDNSFCYNDSAEYCTKYGRLYTWAAAMDSVGEWSTNGRGCGYGSTCSPTLPVRGVCPKGWHLPRRSEWEALFTTVGGSSTAGKKLKSLTGWYNSSNGTDAYSFAALPAGLRDGYGHYEDEGYYAFFWSSTERNGYFAYSMALYYVNDNAFLYTYDYDNSNGFSVRCVKD
ncbi:fibrobacter succinogenes major paralogous domain-containing protein [Fibrobacter sp.]